MPAPSDKSRPDAFRDAARSVGCDDDPDRFKDRLGKPMKHKPVEKPE